MTGTLLQRLQTLFTAAHAAPAEAIFQVSGHMDATAGRLATEAESTAIIGRPQGGTLTSILLDNQEHVIVFAPSHLQDGRSNHAYEDLFSHRLDWALTGRLDHDIPVCFTSSREVQDLSAEIDGARTVLIADRAFRVTDAAQPGPAKLTP